MYKLYLLFIIFALSLQLTVQGQIVNDKSNQVSYPAEVSSPLTE